MPSVPFRIVTLQKDETGSRLLASIFARKEFELTQFTSDREFIAYLRIQPAPHCLIMDLELSQGTTFGLVEKVRKDVRWSKTPIVILAESVDKQELVKLQALKINGYIVKPFQPVRLFNDTLKAMGLEVVTQTTAVKRVKPKTH